MNNLQRLRKERKISQTKLSEQLNVSQATLSFWENGKYDIDNESLLKLSNIFGVSINEILGEDIKKAPSDKPEVTDDDIQFALFGGKVDDETYEDVKRFAAFIKAKKEEQKKEKE